MNSHNTLVIPKIRVRLRHKKNYTLPGPGFSIDLPICVCIGGRFHLLDHIILFMLKFIDHNHPPCIAISLFLLRQAVLSTIMAILRRLATIDDGGSFVNLGDGWTHN